ncbi:hypothetical protein [Helicobacter felis]|uniref:hypothetical protein n=1 Tax=Helicobacter felis TaxID=214 RepID=UPI000CF1806D|nr:hypothetical protein [Helicobacter felis]
MQQKVHNVSYLCKVPFKLDSAKKDLAILPAGAEVVDVTLEMAVGLDGAQVDIGLETKQDYFINDANKDRKFWRSEYLLGNTSTQTIKATITGHDKSQESLAILRVLYFMPSEIVLEC